VKVNHNVRTTPFAIRHRRFAVPRILKASHRFEPNHLTEARGVRGRPHRSWNRHCDTNASGFHPIFEGIAGAQDKMPFVGRRRELGRWRLSRIAAAGALDCPESFTSNSKSVMLETIAIILIVLWLLGLVSSYTMGGFIHILLVAAIIVILVRVIQGRAP
jgi:hypothetical protein